MGGLRPLPGVEKREWTKMWIWWILLVIQVGTVLARTGSGQIRLLREPALCRPLKYPWDNSLFPNITVILACVKQFGFFGLIGSFDLDLTAILWRETEKITAGLIWNRFKTKLYFCLMSALAHQTRSKVCVVTVYG